jgi:hypothetical protein
MIFQQRTCRIGALVAATLTLASLLLVLVLPFDTLLSASNTDMVSDFVSSRAYLAENLRHGHLPLWNPFTYAGQPFLGGFESAVLYPPNLLFLCLPLARALNFLMLLHLVILGWGMERWAGHRGLNPWAAVLAGFFVMPLSGAVFPHIYAGHLPALCTMAWAPWIFLGLEAWIWQGNRRGLFLASAAICLQLLAGHVQYLFFTAVAAGIQSLVVSMAEPAARRRAIPGVAVCYLVGFALGAAQLLPGLATEGIRQQKLDYDFAAMFGFPPENFLTVIAPGFFGNLGTPVYWGRCYFWEMSLFIGTVGPLLIAIALCNNGRKRRGVIIDLVIAGLLLVLALGIHTPVFDFLYRFGPGFAHFRGWSKFTFPATLFLVLVVATGVDFLLREKIPRSVAWLGLLTGLITGAAGLVLLFNPNGITEFYHVVLSSRESYLPAAAFSQPDFIHGAGVHAGLSLGLAGLILISAGVILLFAEKQPLLRWALPALLMLEMIGFVAGQVTVSDVSDAMPDALRQFVAAHPGDYRVLDFARPDNGFLLGAGDLGGNNPSPLRRYAEFINFTQGNDPDHPTQYLPFKSIAPLYALLRLRHVFAPTSEGIRAVESPIPPLPRLLLVSDEKVLAGRNALFSAMQDPSFNPGKIVLLESEPEPHPESGAVGAARLISDLPDELIVEADTSKSALLLITDLYDHNWRVEALPGSSQHAYHLMPADYILRAVPLTAGHHHLRIVYAPTAFSIGIGISVVAWTLWISLLVWDWWLRARRGNFTTETQRPQR